MACLRRSGRHTHLAQEALQALEVAHVADRAVQLRPREVLGQVVLREDLRHEELAAEGRCLGQHGCGDVTRAACSSLPATYQWEESGATASLRPTGAVRTEDLVAM